MMKKHVKITVIMLAAAIIIGRIVYVNATYPFAGIHNAVVGQEIEFEGNIVCVSGAEFYSKSAWKEYLQANNIELEEEKYKLLYGNIDSNTDFSKYDYIVSYNPTQDYTVIVVKLAFTKNAENIDSMIENNMLKVAKELNSFEYPVDDYYSAALSENIQDNERALVYITNELVDSAKLIVFSFGNNMVIDLAKMH